MIKPALNILPELKEGSALHLIIEMGNYGISFTWFSKFPDSIEGTLIYHFEELLAPSEWISVLNSIYRNHSLGSMQHKEVLVRINFPESLFIPGEVYNQAAATELLIRSFQLGPEMAIRTDILKEEKLFNLYGIRKEILDFFQHHYPNMKLEHSSGEELSHFAGSSSLTCIIYHNAFKVFAFKENRFLYSGIFSYHKPIDTAYYLLKICESYGLDPASIPLRLCGMIDEYSILYNEIYKYFGDVSFLPVKEGTALQERIRFYPAHFFSHQTTHISCAS